MIFKRITLLVLAGCFIGLTATASLAILFDAGNIRVAMFCLLWGIISGVTVLAQFIRWFADNEDSFIDYVKEVFYGEEYTE